MYCGATLAVVSSQMCVGVFFICLHHQSNLCRDHSLSILYQYNIHGTIDAATAKPKPALYYIGVDSVVDTLVNF